MRIIVDCQPLAYNCIYSSFSNFIITCHHYIIQKNAEIEWQFVVDSRYVDNHFINAIPSAHIIIKKVWANKAGWKLWYDYQLPLLLKKNKANLLITTGGIISSANIPQCVWITGLRDKTEGYYNLYKKRIKKTTRDSIGIFTVSDSDKMEIIRQNSTESKKVTVIKPFPEAGIKPFSWAEKESTKTKFAAGLEYFLAVVGEQSDNLVDLLKAFSQFKKRLQSNMQFVIAGQGLRNAIYFAEKLESFKYRSDVHVYYNPSENELMQLIPASYALILPDKTESGASILHAFQAEVPVVIPESSRLYEITAGAGLYIDLGNTESLANQLILLYNDEKRRSKLIENGKRQSLLFTKEKAINDLYEVILQVAENV
ncbi:MAG TPA: glycosyltransferase [Puia sp.]|nr:glycosyltransferase [Puia sp.]